MRYSVKEWGEWFEDKTILACVHMRMNDMRVVWVSGMSEDEARRLLLNTKNRAMEFGGELAGLADSTILATEQIEALTMALQKWEQIAGGGHA